VPILIGVLNREIVKRKLLADTLLTTDMIEMTCRADIQMVVNKTSLFIQEKTFNKSNRLNKSEIKEIKE